MAPSVRTITNAEVEACEALLRAAFRDYLAPLGRAPAPDAFVRLPAFVADGHVLGCDVAGELAAVAVTSAHRTHLEVDWLAVAAAHRGRGLASLLLATVEARARAAGAPALRLQTAAMMDRLLRLYGAHGFVERARGPAAHGRDAHPRVGLEKPLRPATLTTPAAVIFDLDGTLVDSEALAAPACVEALAEFGFTLDAATFAARFTGCTDTAIIAQLCREQDRAVDQAAALARIEAHTLERLAGDVGAMPGAHALVRRLAVPKAVASNSAPARIRLCLERTGLRAAFAPHLYSAADVAQGKPAPDLFLHTARRLGVDPTGCVVVEDSVPGVRAAKAAGMTAIGVGPAAAHPALRAAGADACVADLYAVPPLIGV